MDEGEGPMKRIVVRLKLIFCGQQQVVTFMAQDSVDELVFSISKVSKNSIPISQNLKKKEIIDQ